MPDLNTTATVYRQETTCTVRVLGYTPSHSLSSAARATLERLKKANRIATNFIAWNFKKKNSKRNDCCMYVPVRVALHNTRLRSSHHHHHSLTTTRTTPMRGSKKKGRTVVYERNTGTWYPGTVRTRYEDFCTGDVCAAENLPLWSYESVSFRPAHVSSRHVENCARWRD